VEFRFIPQEPGLFSLAPFEVFVPGKQGQTPAVFLRVTGDAGKAGAPSFFPVWENPPAMLNPGEEAILSLRINPENNGGLPSLAPGFRMEVPANALLETLPLTGADQAEGRILRLRLIPLEGPVVDLPGARFSREGGIREIPPLRIRVNPVPPAEPRGAAALAAIPGTGAPDPGGGVKTGAGAKTGGGEGGAAAFPQDPGRAFPLIRRNYEELRERARGLWEQGRRGEALALLRTYERDALLGPFVVPLRRAAEEALGLPPAADEGWRPRRFFAGALFLALAAILSGILRLLFRPSRRGEKGDVTLSRSRGYRGVALFLIIPLGLTVLGFAAGGFLPLGRNKTGAVILGDLEARRVPDPSGAPGAFFREGETALIRSVADSWVYVESPDGKAGWAPVGEIIPY
jgi:hypothetical protein